MKLFTKTHILVARYSTYILVAIIVVFSGGSMVLTVANSAATRQVAINTQKTAMDTHNAVEGEKQILAAIKQAELDNSLTATQKTNIIICMLQVPQPERVPKESDCRKQALTESDTSSKTSQGTPTSASKTSNASSSNNAPSGAGKQSDNSQPSDSASPLINLTSPSPNACIKLKPIFTIC